MPDFKPKPTQRSRELRANATVAERHLWRHLHARQVCNTRFNRQVPIGPFICDFVSRGAKLVIELDGGHHDWRTIKDAARSAYIESLGYRVLRFWNNDVLERTEGVIVEIERVLGSCPPPTPPARGRGEVIS